MSTIDWRPGSALPETTFPPITRTTLALYAGGSGDHNPLHIDADFARKAGLADVIGHGMLTMALMGRYLTGLVPQPAIQSFSTRFQAMSQVGDAITCRGLVVERHDEGRRSTVLISVEAQVGAAPPLALGEARIQIEEAA